jgi:hypothetical protein
VADEFCIEEVDAAGLTVPQLRELEKEINRHVAPSVKRPTHDACGPLSVREAAGPTRPCNAH